MVAQDGITGYISEPAPTIRGPDLQLHQDPYRPSLLRSTRTTARQELRKRDHALCPHALMKMRLIPLVGVGWML